MISPCARSILIVALLFCAGLTIPPAGAGVDERPTIGTEVGQMYPDFVLPSLEGQDVWLSDYRGQKVLLIHFASW